MRYTRLENESDEYVAARERLRLAEIELLEHRERVAVLRRGLPPGATVDDYEFTEGPTLLEDGDEPQTKVRLNELFTGDDRALVVFQMMYGNAQTVPCPMCTMWLDGLDGVAEHVGQNADFVVVAAADVPTLRGHARNRGWNGLRLLSAGETSFKFDLGSEDADGNQTSTISVFDRDADGTVRHTYTAHPHWSETGHQRGIDLLSPVWHLLDLTPQGRGDWYADLRYDG